MAGDQDVMDRLVSGSIDVNTTNEEGENLLFWVAESGWGSAPDSVYEIASTLMSLGADPYQLSKDKQCAMTVVEINGSKRMMAILGANPHQ